MPVGLVSCRVGPGRWGVVVTIPAHLHLAAVDDSIVVGGTIHDHVHTDPGGKLNVRRCGVFGTSELGTVPLPLGYAPGMTFNRSSWWWLR